MLEWKLKQNKDSINEMLDLYIQAETYKKIDCKKHFDECMIRLEKIIKVFFAYQYDDKHIKRMRTDPEVIKRMHEYFEAVYLDKHYQPFFSKSNFFDGIINYFNDQTPVQRGMFGDNQIAIAISSDDKYEAFLKGDEGILENEEEDENVEDPVAEMVKNLEHTKEQY